MDFLESLSLILEQVGDTMTDISSKFAKGSEEFVQVTKIKMKISKTKDEIEYYLRDLGNIYYKQVKAIENDNGEDVVSLIEKIDACYEEIDKLKIELDFINKIRRDEELQFSSGGLFSGNSPKVRHHLFCSLHSSLGRRSETATLHFHL